MLDATSDGKRLLDETVESVLEGSVHDGMERLVSGLHETRAALESEEWRDVCRLCLSHPLCEVVHQDPLTSRAYRKPRGYAGDAVVLDYYYQRWDGLLDGVTELGRQLLDYTTAHPVSSAMRDRKDRMAEAIDEASSQKSDARIFSVAAGHVREAHQSEAVQSGALGELVALDQDRESLATVEKNFAGLPVTPLYAKIRDLIKDEIGVGDSDLIYSMGLYDYLEQPIAQRLTEVLFGKLRPGGRLILANFIPGVTADGYVESFMDWNLIYRDLDRLADCSVGIPKAEISSVDAYADKWGFIGYVDIIRG